jgi:hypothetical protein
MTDGSFGSMQFKKPLIITFVKATISAVEHKEP